MPRKLSSIAPDWWDYTTLDDELIRDVAKLTIKDIEQLARPGFRIVFYDTLEDFYLAEALEYIQAWRASSPDNPCGICGPIGPTEQLPLVARLVNELELNLKNAHFWGMDEWVENNKPVSAKHPLSFERADRELCFDRIRPDLRMPEAHLHFPKHRRLRISRKLGRRPLLS
jgi:glucosamine-6-phosphate deaminase